MGDHRGFLPMTWVALLLPQPQLLSPKAQLQGTWAEGSTLQDSTSNKTSCCWEATSLACTCEPWSRQPEIGSEKQAKDCFVAGRACSLNTDRCFTTVTFVTHLEQEEHGAEEVRKYSTAWFLESCLPLEDLLGLCSPEMLKEMIFLSEEEQLHTAKLWAWLESRW